MNGATAYDGDWDLTPADRLLIEAKRWGSRLRFAVMLMPGSAGHPVVSVVFCLRMILSENRFTLFGIMR